MTYLSNTMSQTRLNHAMCLSVHREMLDALDLKLVMNYRVSPIIRQGLY